MGFFSFIAPAVFHFAVRFISSSFVRKTFPNAVFLLSDQKRSRPDRRWICRPSYYPCRPHTESMSPQDSCAHLQLVRLTAGLPWFLTALFTGDTEPNAPRNPLVLFTDPLALSWPLLCLDVLHCCQLKVFFASSFLCLAFSRHVVSSSLRDLCEKLTTKLNYGNYMVT